MNIAVWIEFAGFFNSENGLLIGGKEGGAVGIGQEKLGDASEVVGDDNFTGIDVGVEIGGVGSPERVDGI